MTSPQMTEPTFRSVLLRCERWPREPIRQKLISLIAGIYEGDVCLLKRSFFNDRHETTETTYWMGSVVTTIFKSADKRRQVMPRQFAGGVAPPHRRG